jgi:hypothetical protein
VAKKAVINKRRKQLVGYGSSVVQGVGSIEEKKVYHTCRDRPQIFNSMCASYHEMKVLSLVNLPDHCQVGSKPRAHANIKVHIGVYRDLPTVLFWILDIAISPVPDSIVSLPKP